MASNTPPVRESAEAAPPAPTLGPRGVPLYVKVHQGNTDELGRIEWLLASGDGGFAMGTVLGAPSRRYHGLLVASLRAPVQRVMALSALAESVLIEPDSPTEARVDLSCFRFRPGELHPRGEQYLTRFEKDTTCRWHWQRDRLTVTKEVALVRGASAVLVRYTLAGEARPLRLILRPLVALRDFHALTLRDTSRERLSVKHHAAQRALVVSSPAGPLHIGCSAGRLEVVEQWWHNFQYDLERDRGYDYLEDLYHPGTFVVDLPAGDGAPAHVTLAAGLGAPVERDMAQHLGESLERGASLLEKARAAVGGVGTHNDAFSALACAADDFVVRRAPLPGGAPPRPGPGGKVDDPVTVIAGYPWFSDWGRDTMIALPGLLLCTGRHDEARRLLATFAAHAQDGLVPNVFDDYTGQPHYNTVDASLWYIHATCEYLRATGDRATFTRDLLPACLAIVRAYREGTRFGIRMDPADGLIAAGDPGTQLTWMDAKRDGVVFTPRHGKAVEINALWHHALASLVEAAGAERPALRVDLGALRDRVARSFVDVLWDSARGHLLDGVYLDNGEWRAHAQVRPNQVFAVSLRHSPLSKAQKAGVMKVARERLLTPLGLRTLDPADPGYKGRYRGRMFERDAAYHNGTVWPWLLGPYAEGVLRAGEFSTLACREARAALAPLIARVSVDCPGQLAEAFDGDDTPEDPRQPGGCPAQAWSVAEPLRVLSMVIKAERGVKGL